MNRKLTIMYETFDDLDTKAMSVVDEKGVVINIFRDEEAEELFNKMADDKTERNVVMKIKLYTFNEALEKLKKMEIPMLVRSKFMKADFQNKCILLYQTERYVSLGDSYVCGNPNILWQTVLKEGRRTSSYAKIESDDILADDYIDTSQWTLCDNEKDYEKAKKIVK